MTEEWKSSLSELEQLKALRDYVDENPIEFHVTGETESDEQTFIRYYNKMHAMLPDLLKAVEALREAKSLLLEMGNEIRAMDDNSDVPGYWTNDGEYIIDERFGKVDRALRKLAE